jgi:hypothetical protein
MNQSLVRAIDVSDSADEAIEDRVQSLSPRYRPARADGLWAVTQRPDVVEVLAGRGLRRRLARRLFRS